MPGRRRRARGLLKKIALALVILLLLTKLPALALLFLTGYALFLALRWIAGRLSREEVITAPKPKRPPSIRVPRRIKSLIEVGEGAMVNMYVPSPEARCLIVVKGLQVIAVGGLAVRALSEVRGSLGGLFASAASLGYGVTCILKYEPDGTSMLLLLVHVRKLALEVDEALVRELAEEVARRLEWARAALAANVGGVLAEPLTGSELAGVLQEVIAG